VEECGPCPVFAGFTLAFALQLRKKHGKPSVRVRKTSVRLRKTSVRVQYTYYQNTHTLQNPHIHTHTHTHTHITKQCKTTTVQIKTKCLQEKEHNGEKEQYLDSTVVNPQL
jgi:microcystin-dependent protein